jgi:diadenosine tetraphosphate (Ap4A) HIT family hydrolase
MQMSNFELHPRLAADCHQLGHMEISQLLLMDNALVPWFILVPDTDKREMFELDAEQQYLVQQEVNALSGFLMARADVEKINLGALGNLVPQLHIHVIGRNSNDFCWPDPVWGQEQKTAWAKEAVAEISQQLVTHLKGGLVNYTPGAKLRPKSQ